MVIMIKISVINPILNIATAVYSPISARTICPALILAANRKDSVSGRTVILTVSIKIKNGFNHVGAPSGRK
jgi:hypothetical protein